MILVVESDSEVRDGLVRLLDGHGHSVSALATPDEARKALTAGQYTLVICDAHLPGEPALQLLRDVRAEHPDLPFIVLAGDADPGFAAALELGAFGYISKPVGANEVVFAVASAYIRSGLEKQNRVFREQLQEMVKRRTVALEKALSDLRSREAQLRILADNAHDLIFKVGVDPALWVEYVSPSAERLLGYSPQEFYDDPTLLGRLFPGLELLSAREERTGPLDVPVTCKDGSVVWLGLAVSPLKVDGRVVALEGIGRDVTKRRLNEQSSRHSATQQAAVAELGSHALSDLGMEAVMTEAVDIIAKTLQVDYASVLELLPGGRSFVLRAAKGWPEEMIGTHAPPNATNTQAGYTIASGGPVVVDNFATDARFTQHPLLQAAGVVSGISVLIGERNLPYGALSAHTTTERHFDDDDVRFMASLATVLAAAVERHRTEDNLRQRALHDPLTGLANRALFMDHLEQAIERSTRRGTIVALVFLDVDRFKRVNDRFGHGVGDQLLQAVAQRLQLTARRIDTVARLGGDEFAVVCEDSATTVDAMTAARRLADAFVDRIEVAGAGVSASVSLGVAVAEPGEDAATVLRHADLAMYRAKKAGRARFEVWGEHGEAVEPRLMDAGG